MLSKTVLDFADSALPGRQAAALKAVDRLCVKRCTKALTYIMNEYSGSALDFHQQLANKARECL